MRIASSCARLVACLTSERCRMLSSSLCCIALVVGWTQTWPLNPPDQFNAQAPGKTLALKSGTPDTVKLSSSFECTCPKGYNSGQGMDVLGTIVLDLPSSGEPAVVIDQASVIVSSSLISIPDDSTMQWNVTSPLTTGWKTSIYSGTVRGTVKISETDNAAWTLLGSWEKSVEVTAAEGGGGGGGGDPPAGG